MSGFSVMRVVELASVFHCEDTHDEISRFIHLGLYAEPAPVATTSGSASVGETGPKLMEMLRTQLISHKHKFTGVKYPLFEGTSLYASTTHSWRNAVQTCGKSIGTVVSFVYTVTAHTVVAAVKNR
jgi:hypothetical protein